MDDVTFCIKTFERPGCLASMVGSIRRYYPDVPIVVADDSRPATQDLVGAWSGVDHLRMEFDAGMSAGRNEMVKAAKTRWVMLLDDDFLFTPETRVEVLRDEAERLGLEIVGARLIDNGVYQHYEGLLWRDGDRMVFGRLHSVTDTIRVHICLNFFLAERDALMRVPWDASIKVCEHEEYFWRAKEAGVTVGYCPRVTAMHLRHNNPFYLKFRSGRARQFRTAALAKHGFVDVAGVLL